MHVETLKERIEAASSDLDVRRYHYSLQSIVEKEKALKGGNFDTDIIMIEEMSELTKEITKKLRGEDRDPLKLIEEIVDVAIMLDRLIKTHDVDIELLYKCYNVKLERIESIIREYDKKLEEKNEGN